MKRWILANVAFIAGSLVSAGSIITEGDLGTYDYVDDQGERHKGKVAPPRDAIEVDENGNAKSKKDAYALSELIGSAAVPFGGAAPAQAPGGVALAANQLQPAITAGHTNLADLAGAEGGTGGADAVHGMDPTVGNLSPDVIIALTQNPEFMAALAKQLGTQTPPVVEQAQENAAASGAPDKVEGGKPPAGVNAASEAPARRGAADKDADKK